MVGWQVEWDLHQNIHTNTWNADIDALELESDSIQYIASNLNWNELIKVNQTIEFGFQGDKLEAELEIPIVYGENCQIKISE